MIVYTAIVILVTTVLLTISVLLSPHSPYQEKNSTFECGFHSFLGQNRTQFSISFFIFALLFLLFDLEILLVYPYVVSGYGNEIYGLIVILVFFILLALGFVFELGKNALKIDSRQVFTLSLKDSSLLIKAGGFRLLVLFIYLYIYNGDVLLNLFLKLEFTGPGLKTAAVEIWENIKRFLQLCLLYLIVGVIFSFGFFSSMYIHLALINWGCLDLYPYIVEKMANFEIWRLNLDHVVLPTTETSQLDPEVLQAFDAAEAQSIDSRDIEMEMVDANTSSDDSNMYNTVTRENSNDTGMPNAPDQDAPDTNEWGPNYPSDDSFDSYDSTLDKLRSSHRLELLRYPDIYHNNSETSMLEMKRRYMAYYCTKKQELGILNDNLHNSSARVDSFLNDLKQAVGNKSYSYKMLKYISNDLQNDLAKVHNDKNVLSLFAKHFVEIQKHKRAILIKYKYLRSLNKFEI